MADVDCFASRGFNTNTYLLFFLSGLAAGILGWRVAQQQPAYRQPWDADSISVLAIALGVLYHLKVATGWWTREAIVQQILFAGEFLAPAAFVLAALTFLRTNRAAGNAAMV